MACRDWAAKVGGGVLGRAWALVAALALLLGLIAMAPVPAQAASFRDVPSGQWYTSWVDKASDQDLMSGFTDPATGRPTGYFGPDEPLTRAQVATVLWRMAGGPSSGHASFPDVERGSWYDAPVAWCVKAGVVTGYTSGPDRGYFRPDRPVTRQELATMVYRYAKYAGMDVADPDPSAFRSTTDWRTVDSWASEALTWTAAAGVLSGVDNHDGTYSVVPFGTATRAMAAKVFVVLSGSPSAAKASYTVAFDSNGGSAVKAQTVKNGAKASKPADPTKSGYAFKGWYSDKSLTKAFNFNSTVKSNLTLYAKWEAKATYTVTFNANGGTAVKAQSVSSGAKASKPANPTKAGYAFKGWYSDKSLIKAYDFNSAVKSNLTLYAKWAKAATYTVTFNSNGGSSVKAQTVAAGSRAAIPTAPTRPGYAFTGWYASKSATQYNDGSYRADGRGIGGKVPVTVVVSGGRVSEVCVGDNSETRGIGSKVIERIPGEIVRQNGTDNVDVVSGATVTSKAIVAAVGECLAKAGRGEVYDFACAVNDDTTLYAGWVKAGFVVSFDGNGSQYGSAQFVLPGSKAVAPANPARPDGTLTFSGWYSDSKLTNRYDFSVPVTVDLTLYAKWDSQTQLYAILYSDGLLSLQKGSDEGASHGTVLGKWVWDASSRPWYDKRARVKSVVVRDGIAASNGGGMFSDLSNCRSMDLSKLDVSGASGLSHMFSDCSRLQSLDLSGWDVSNATDFGGTFSGCSSLTSLDLSGWDVSNATDLGSMFWGCSSLTSLDLSSWDVSNVMSFTAVYVGGMFSGCSSLTSLDLSGWDVSKASDLSYMFDGCSSLASLDLSGWDVSNASNLYSMFSGCSSLTSLDISGWDVSNASDLHSMFDSCPRLQSLDVSGWDVSNASSLSDMFQGCSSLTSLDVSGWDVSNASSLSGMFQGCSSLTSLDLSSWDVSNASSLSGMFWNCSSLGTVTLGVGCGPLVGELPYGPWYDAEGKEYDRPPAGVAGTFTKTKTAALAVAVDAGSDADVLLSAQIAEGERGGLRYVIVPENSSFENGLEYPVLAGRYVGPGVYLTGYAGEGDSLVVPLEVAGVPVVSVNLSWNDSDRSGMTRLVAVSFERVEGKASSLVQLDVSGNGLSLLDIEGLDALVRLNCEGNPIADLAALQTWAAQDGHEAKLPQVQDAAPAELGDAAAPSEPSAPEPPSEPDTPAVEPGEPSEPEAPSEPAEPEVPSEPEAPSEPETPSEPEEPSVEPSPAEDPSDDPAASDEANLASDSLELGEDPVSALAA